MHDLNNQLGVILTYCALLARGAAGTAAAADVAEVKAAAARAVEVSAALRSWHREHDGSQ